MHFPCCCNTFMKTKSKCRIPTYILTNTEKQSCKPLKRSLIRVLYVNASFSHLPHHFVFGDEHHAHGVTFTLPFAMRARTLSSHTHPPTHRSRRPGGGGSVAGMAQMLPASTRQQINQQVGQAVTNAAMNELSNVFASKFK